MKRRNLIQFLSAIGISSFIPSSLKAQNSCITTQDILGPFYTPGAPFTQDLVPEGAEGTLLFLTGTVYYNDGITHISNATIDAWQANHFGAYDNIGFNFRGKFDANETGNYSMKTILPGKYLNGTLYRPRHIHFKIWKGETELLVTQLYFEGDTDIDADPWASQESAACRTITLNPDADGNLHGVFDIALDIEPPISDSIQNFNDSNFIMAVSPQPVEQKGTISLNITQTSNVEIKLFNLNGQVVSDLFSGRLNRGLHKIDLLTQNNLGLKIACGIYIVQLIIDNKPIDAKRIVVK